MKKNLIYLAVFLLCFIHLNAEENGSQCTQGSSWNGKHCTSTLLGTICTGQTKCYDNNKEIPCPKSSKDEFFGQDPQYAKKKKCKPQSFQIKTVSKQNIVIDNNTGLVWQQSIPKEEYNWEDALNYCEKLTYAGYSDWRLPTPQELLTIVDNSKRKPAINTTYFPNTPSREYWSSSVPSDNSTTGAWIVNFISGDVYMRFRTYAYPVRCVR